MAAQPPPPLVSATWSCHLMYREPQLITVTLNMSQQNTSEGCPAHILLNQVCLIGLPSTFCNYLMLLFSVVVSKSVTNVKPEVLASGRILTHMTPIPANLKYVP